MKISKSQLTAEIKTKVTVLERHLSARVQTVLELLLSEDLKATGDGKIELFDLLIRLILQADREPASMIANLLVPLDSEATSQLDEWTLSNSGAFLRDYLKRDYILYILKSKEPDLIKS